MTVIAFDSNKKSWVDINGERTDIKIKPSHKDDYFYHIDETEFVLHCYSESVFLSDYLGEILTRRGDLVQNIPPLKSIEKIEKHVDIYGRYNISWVSEEGGGLVSFVIDTSSIRLLRVFFNFKELKYTGKIVDAR